MNGEMVEMPVEMKYPPGWERDHATTTVDFAEESLHRPVPPMLMMLSGREPSLDVATKYRSGAARWSPAELKRMRTTGKGRVPSPGVDPMFRTLPLRSVRLRDEARKGTPDALAPCERREPVAVSCAAILPAAIFGSPKKRTTKKEVRTMSKLQQVADASAGHVQIVNVTSKPAHAEDYIPTPQASAELPAGYAVETWMREDGKLYVSVSRTNRKGYVKRFAIPVEVADVIASQIVSVAHAQAVA
jgi:hypothetical protein